MAKTSDSKETPLMKQYHSIKARYPGALLLFRVGDFYETFGEDAIAASQILDIVLTRRSNGAASEVELAGFPYHALDVYLPKLVRAGRRVAICDQLEDPKMVKGIVKRGVTELVTPGLSLHDQVLDTKKNNFLAAIYYDDLGIGIAFLDLSTGEFLVATGEEDYIGKLVQGFLPAEIIYNKSAKNKYESQFGDQFSHLPIEDWCVTPDYGYERLIRHFRTQHLKGFGIEDMPPAIAAAGAILYYLEETEHRETSHIRYLSRIDSDKYLWMDRFTIRNLELLQATQSDGVPLFQILDQVVTPMGSRLLRKWLVLPLKDKAEIEKRLQIVEALGMEEELTEQLQQQLKPIGDIERLTSKVATGRINPRELYQLKRGIGHVQEIKKILERSSHVIVKQLSARLDGLELLHEQIHSHLADNPPLQLHQGDIIRTGIDSTLDEYRTLTREGKDYLIQLQQREAIATGIPSLKVAYNKVFGYYLEVTHAHKDKVPETWIRKQTLVNAERYITEELKIYEEKILHAEERMFAIENRLFNELLAFTRDFTGMLQQNGQALAMLDCLSNFSIQARKYQYVRPTLTEDSTLDIKEGRHPVIERLMQPGQAYIPNDIYLNSESQQILIITGPNMAGKSAVLRQTALIILMAQMGCFVPAGYAKIGITDKIFSRVGASDNLSRGESTFMVEMTETAAILNNLSSQSLVIMDEIGRGTSTYDGISIAWSTVEYLHNHPKFRAKTLFATHYHELNEIAEKLPRVKNYHVSVKELKDRVVFLRKLVAGGTAHSFGIHVAQMAGMPNAVVLRSNEILKKLESKNAGQDKKITDIVSTQQFQLNLFESDPRIERLMALLRGIDINTLSPVEALLKLNEMKEIIKGK